MLYPTQNGPRPDLALAGKMSQADMGGYAFTQLFPVLPTTERAGDFSYAPVNLSNATTNVAEGRANGAALTASELKTADFAWTTARLEARSVVYDNEVKSFGGIENADKNGGIDAVRRAYNKVEVAAYSKVFSAARILAATSLADQEIINLLSKGAIAARPYGSPYLVLTTNGLLKMLQIPEVRKAMFGSFTAAQVMNMLTGTDKDLILSKLSPLLSMKGMIIFDSDIVTGVANDDCIAIVALRPEAFAGNDALLRTAKQKAVYGFTAIYIPEGASKEMPFGVSATAHGDGKVNLYDAESRYSINEIHTDAVKVFKMLANLTDYSENLSPLKVEITNPPISTPAE
jgi:hypothetical protein